MSDWMNEWVQAHQVDNQRVIDGCSRLKDLDLVVLDNSVRESTVGQLRGHTPEDKFKIFEEAERCGFKVCTRFFYVVHGGGQELSLNSFWLQRCCTPTEMIS